MKLKQVSLIEFEIIFDILHENALWLASRDIFQWPLDWLEAKRDEIQSSVEQGLFYSLTIDGDIAAVVEITSIADEFWENDESAALYVHKLAIRREFSGQSLGRKIIGLIEEKAIQQGINYLRLDCVAHNLKLREYYESCLFQFKGEVNLGEINLALFEYEISAN